MTQESERSDPLISVIIPTCNRRSQLANCVESLARQTFPNYEIIVIDDGSDDDTVGFLQDYAARHPTLALRWYRNEVNSGPNHSRNRGVAESRGDILAFTDSDCIAEPDWLQQLQRPFEQLEVAAVVGNIQDPPVRNIFELTYRGGNRIPGHGDPGRMVGCNMAVRRAQMLKVGWDVDWRYHATVGNGMPDTLTSGRCDDEGVYLMLRAMGYQQRTVQEAVVLHEHHYSGRSFFRQAYIGGGSAAHLVYKYRLRTRIDVLPFLLAYITLPLMLVDRRLWLAPAFFFVGACLALLYNDIRRKGKTVGQTLQTFPILLAYYHVRVAGYVIHAIRLRCRKHKMQRVDLRKLVNSPQPRPS